MNWINMLPWYQWLIFGLVPPLIFLLYFLKLRRVPLEVPSTFLWKRTVEDLHVNSIWQRLRKNLLLLLQLLAVLLLALACLNPGCEGTRLKGDRFIFVLDRSSSMSATDGGNGMTRLEAAKQQIETMIDQMDSSDVAMIISFSDDANVDQSYTTSTSLLKQKLAAITQSHQSSDLNEALLAASGLANPGRTSDRASETDVQVADALPARLLIFSDGAVKKAPEFRLGNLSAEYRPVGALTGGVPANIGITAFSINDQLEFGNQAQAFARIQNSGMQAQKVGVSLYVEGILTDARQVSIEGLQTTSINFDLTSVATGLESSIPIELKIDDQDLYLNDNSATCVLNPPRVIEVLVVTDNPGSLKLAMNTDRLKQLANTEFQGTSFLQSPTYRDSALLGKYDLVVFDRCIPEILPSCNAVFWGSLPGTDWEVRSTVTTAPIVDVNNAHPLMFDLQMASVNILTPAILAGPQGTVPLLQTTEGPIMALGPRGGFEDVVIGFPLATANQAGEMEINTDWPKTLSFPFFVQNLVLVLGGASQFNTNRSFEPGELIDVRPRLAYDSLMVTNPDGKTEQIDADADARFIFTDTESCGIYQVQGAASSVIDHLFTVNLMDRLESDLTVREELSLGDDPIQGSLSTEQVRKTWWTWAVLVCLLVLTIEWYIYNRRVFI